MIDNSLLSPVLLLSFCVQDTVMVLGNGILYFIHAFSFKLLDRIIFDHFYSVCLLRWLR